LQRLQRVSIVLPADNGLFMVLSLCDAAQKKTTGVVPVVQVSVIYSMLSGDEQLQSGFDPVLSCRRAR
jgi:hypothetical protein